MLYTLLYVNLPNDETINLDRHFINPDTLEEWVKRHYPNFTSYQMIVVNQRPQS